MDGDHRGYYQFRRKLAAGYAALAILLISLLGWKIVASERATRAADLSITEAIAKSMAAHVEELTDAVNQPLTKAALDIAALPDRDMTASKVEALLSSATGTADARFWLLFVNEKGVGVAASNGMSANGLSFADEPYFFDLARHSEPPYFLEIGRAHV